MNGRLEDLGVFKRRKYCDMSCMGKGMIQSDPQLPAYRQRAQKLRGSSCENCGSTERLHTHHKDGNVKNNAKENIGTLCASCHLKLHWKEDRKKRLLIAHEQRLRRFCIVCGKDAQQRGLCPTHAKKMKRNGHPLLTRRKDGSQFWETIEWRFRKTAPKS